VGAVSHCATCNCRDDEKPAQPAVSSAWARKQAIDAAAEAVRKVKEARKRPIEESPA